MENLIVSCEHGFSQSTGKQMILRLADGLMSDQRRLRNVKRMLLVAFPGTTIQNVLPDYGMPLRDLRLFRGEFRLKSWEEQTIESLNERLQQVFERGAVSSVTNGWRPMQWLLIMNHHVNSLDLELARGIDGIRNAVVSNEPVYGSQVIELFVPTWTEELRHELTEGQMSFGSLC